MVKRAASPANQAGATGWPSRGYRGRDRAYNTGATGNIAFIRTVGDLFRSVLMVKVKQPGYSLEPGPACFQVKLRYETHR